MTSPIVKRFLIAFEQHKLLGLFIFLLSLGISGIVALQPDPPQGKTTYKASGQLTYNTPPPLFTTTGEQLQQQGRDMDVKVLLSPQVQADISQKLRLNSKQLQDIIDRKLKIDVPEKAKIPVITLEYSNAATPEEAVNVLGVFMTEMVAQSQNINKSVLNSRIEALQSRLDTVRGQLAATEETFYRFITGEGTSLLAIQDGSLFASLTGSQQQQRQLKLVLEEIDGQINSIVRQLGLSPEQAYTAAALSADPLLANLRAQLLELETQKKRLIRDLRPEHPNLVALDKQITINEELLQERAREVLGGNTQYTALPSQLRQEISLDPARQQLANTLVTLKTQREGIQRQLNSVIQTETQLKQQYEQFPELQLKQARLAQEVETKRNLYQTILAALTDAQSAEAETTGSFAIVQTPAIEEVPPGIFAPPNRILILAAGAGIGLLASTAVIVLLGMLDDRLHTEKELQEAFVDREVPILGTIPYVTCFNLQGEECAAVTDTNSVFLSFYERIRSSISRYTGGAAKVVLVTSVNNSEGKSVTAYNLAIANAVAGKRTLLIEADLRSSSNAHWLQLDKESETAIEPLQYYASNMPRLVPGIPNLYTIPSPGPLRQVAAIIESGELRRCIENARGAYDAVIIDTTSLAQSNDALLLEPLTDGIVFVARTGIAQASLLGDTLDRFTETEIPILGAVINDLDRVIPHSDSHLVEVPTPEPAISESQS
ncbi:MAG: GumC family protein [Pleurocapsa sp.]